MYFGQEGSNADNNSSATVCDILDPFSTTKNTTIRSLSGHPVGTSTRIALYSGAWNNTASITSITLLAEGTNYAATTRLSLYGIKG
jgi:hypothetical protein